MAARTNSTGAWSSSPTRAPTREIPSSRLIRLIEESRHGRPIVERIHQAPTRQFPAALEHLERVHCNNLLIDLQSLDDPDPLGPELAAPAPRLPVLRSEPDGEEETATRLYAPITKDVLPPTARPAPSVAARARRGRRRVAVRRLLCLGVFVFLCLGLIVFLGNVA